MTGSRAVLAGRADVGAGPYGGDERGPCPPFAGELPAELTSPALAPPSRGSCPRSGLRGADLQRAVFTCMGGVRPPPALRATSPARGEVFWAGRQGRKKAGAALGGPGRVGLFT